MLTAQEIATKYHEGQTRKDGITPYIKHPEDVVNLLKEWDVKYRTILDTAWLHDILEDTKLKEYDLFKLGVKEEICNGVGHLTIQQNQTKDQYLKILETKSCEVILVKIADRICNTRDFIKDGKLEYATTYLNKARKLITSFYYKINQELLSILPLNIEHDVQKTLTELNVQLKCYPRSYILIKETVNNEDYLPGKAINSAAHAGSIILLKWGMNDHTIQDWLNLSIRKVTCKVTDKEFEKAKTYEDHVVITEKSCNDAEVAIVFKPRYEYSRFFKFLRLYK